MENKKTEFCKEETNKSSSVGRPVHEDSNNASQPGDFEKKKLIDTDYDSTIEVSSAQDKQNATKEVEASNDGEDFLLRLESSDEETFKEAAESKIDAKLETFNKTENLFSDIESSDDSIVYEPKSNSAVLPGVIGKGNASNVGEEKKTVESEFDPVESDEEFFEDLSLSEKTEEVSQEIVLDTNLEEVEEEEERNSTPLIDEENDNCTELDTPCDGVDSIETSINIKCNLELACSQSEQSMDLMLEDSVEIPEQIIHDSSEPTNTEIETTADIATSLNLADDKSTDALDDEESSVGPILNPEILEQTDLPSTETDSLDTDCLAAGSSKQTGDVALSQVSSCNPAPHENSSELLEDLQIESSECPKMVQEVQHSPKNMHMNSTIPDDIPETKETEVNAEITEEELFASSEISTNIHDSEDISMSPSLEDEIISSSVQPEPIETDIETTQESNMVGDETIEDNLLELQVKDAITSEKETPEEEDESMQVDDTTLEVKNVSEIETIESDTKENKSDQFYLHQNVLQNPSEKERHLKAVEEQEIYLQSDDAFEENIVVKTIPSTDENLIKESTDIEDKVSDLEPKSLEGNETAISQDLLAEASTPMCDPVEEQPINETEETEIDIKCASSPEVHADEEMKEVESTETENLDDVIKESHHQRATSPQVSAEEEMKEVDSTEKENSDKVNKESDHKQATSPQASAEDEMKKVKSTEKENLYEVIKESDHKRNTSLQASAEEELKEVESTQKENLDEVIKESHHKCAISPQVTPEEELKEIESTEKENLDEVINESDHKLATSSQVSAEEEIKEVESTAKENFDTILKKSDVALKLLEKPDEVQDATEKLSEITASTLDDSTATKEVIDSNKTLDKTEITHKISEDCLKIQMEDNKEEDKSKNSIEQVIELNEKKESPKENYKLAEKTEETLVDVTEKIESPQKIIDTLQISNKELSDSTESCKQILETVEHSKEKLESQQKKTSEESSEQTAEIEESIIEPMKLVDGSDVGDSIEFSSQKIKSTTDKANKQEKCIEQSAQPLTDKIEKLSEPETDSIEKRQTAVSSKKDLLEKQDSIKEHEISNSKKSEPMKSSELICSTEEEVVEKAATLTETIKPKEINESTAEPEEKTTALADPEIIEIDDDDDLEEVTKLKDNSKKEENALSSTIVKELQDRQSDDVTKTSENKETKELITPMDVDENNTTKTIAKEQTTNLYPKTNKESDNAVDAMIKTPVQVIDDDDEPLLMIDESHKEDNDTESNFMGNETATSAPTTDSSSDGSLEVFYDKECVNYECKRTNKNFYRATVFAMSYFKVSKKRSKTQFVCEDCYDRALSSYEELCKTLKLKQPLLHGTTFKCQEFVEIIDSSDEDENDAGDDKVKVSDENELPKESIAMLEAELEGAIRKVMHSVDIQKQLSWTKQILQQRLTNMQDDSNYISEQLRALQRKADHMHNSLYQCPKIKLRQLTPLDLNSGRMYNPESDNTTSIPLPGDIIRNPICVNEQYYAVKTKAIASWVPCKVIEEVDSYPVGYNQSKTYKIKFTTKLAKYPMFKTVFAKHMAYYDSPNVRLPIGSRVIAYFDATSLSRGKEKMLIPSAFYPGIIAEPLKQSNKFRYLVFYDDGYFQYVNHKDVRLVCQASENVWEDVHHQSREFIHNYLTQYAVNRPMVQTQKGQSMLVDYNGKWIYARVIDVDCSLVQMLFEGQSRSEWIYRGSTRLGPVYKESNNLSQKNTLNATRRRTEPFIRYINGDDSSSHQVQETEQSQTKAGSNEIRSVAKKSVSRVDTSNNNSTSSSTAQPVPTVRHLNNSTIFVDDDNKPKGKVVYYTARKNLPPRTYVPHICNPSCPFNITHNLSFYSPLAKPLLSGWERQVFRQKSKKLIIYRGPCGKRMRNIEELHRYLRVTDNELNVDNFDFSPDTNCLAEYVLEKCLVNKKDISCGKEKMPIPCVNYYDETMPPACEYSAVRIPTEGVPLNLNEEFLCGCDCEDDCSDKTKCECWQLTYAGAKYGMPSVPTDMVGYQYKRLYEHVPTGIYECNSRCKCKASCVNRVVQQPLQSKLQVFKTSNRGWGLRCINDVPRGSFICVYAGQMLTEQVANEGGLDAGDEYFAELDYIEVAEQIKEGYESDVQEPEEDEDLYNPERDDDDIDFRVPGESFKDKEFSTRLRTRKGNKNSTDGEFDSQERQVISFEPNKNMDTSNEPNEKPTIRKLFGKDESCYVMDAKVRGNLGRYFNHSCSPNLFVQNVFVDTHDLRFPWVAFFASTHIRAGTELTWNYNYEVGVVPGKVLYCQCGAPNCRQRLL